MSDPYQVVVCTKCGNIATTQTECKSCDTNKVVKVNLPYAAKHLAEKGSFKRVYYLVSLFTRCKTPYNDGNSLRALNTTFGWKQPKGTRSIAVHNGNNFKDWVIRG